MKIHLPSLLATFLVLGITSCKPADQVAKEPSPTPNADTAPASSASAEADLTLLAGTVPHCPELTSAARLGYRQAAFRACELAVTADQRMKNPGCYARQRISQCVQSEESRDYTLEQYNAEKKSALN